MATSANLTSTLEVRYKSTQTVASDLSDGAPDVINQTLSKSTTYGTTSNKADKVFHDQATASAAAVTYDLADGTLTDIKGASVVMAKVRKLVIHNTSTTTTEKLTIGGGSDPIAGISGEIGPDGWIVWENPVDGYTVGANADVITVDPGADTITFDIWIVGTSA